MPKDNRSRYKATCVTCNHTFYACKSILQEWGEDSAGHGSCPKCKEFLNLTFDSSTQTMITKKWDDHIQAIKAQEVVHQDSKKIIRK